jgi:hypothetical protein
VACGRTLTPSNLDASYFPPTTRHSGKRPTVELPAAGR